MSMKRIVPSKGILMSVSGIASTLFDSSNQTVQNNMQQFNQEFQQLGKDLHSGNLSAAHADFVTLQKLGPKGISDPTIQSDNPLSQAFNKLSQDLSSGNVSAAQQDYAKIQQAFQNQASRAHGHHHHSGGSENGGSSSTAPSSSLSLNA
jgi:predicted lipid-binding transport protein (Tim44 family)